MVEKDATSNNAKVIAPGLFKLDLKPLSPKLLNNKDARIDYIKHSREDADTLQGIVKHARALRPLDSDLDSACKYVKRIQEDAITIDINAIALLRQAIKSLPGRNDGIANAYDSDYDDISSAKAVLMANLSIYDSDVLFEKVQVNTKILNALQPEWSKFVTDVKLAKNMYNTNFDQLYAYLSQHEGHANEARMLCERYPDPLALVANYQTQSNSAQYPQQLSSTTQPNHSSQLYLSTYEAPHHPQSYQHAFQTQLNHTPPSVP
nr:retrovirus-related Pol polyprotein from transposon TNT 1-94 [Tanacetum cinerariifolium]